MSARQTVPRSACVVEASYSVYGARKVWRPLWREGRDLARCTIERLMRDLGLAGAIGGKPVKTTVSDKGAVYPIDKVNWQFRAPEPSRKAQKRSPCRNGETG